MKNDPRLPQTFVHFCDRCLKQYSYSEKGEKLANFQLYPFIDEHLALNLREKSRAKPKLVPKSVTIKLDDDEASHVVINPILEESDEEINGAMSPLF